MLGKSNHYKIEIYLLYYNVKGTVTKQSPKEISKIYRFILTSNNNLAIIHTYKIVISSYIGVTIQSPFAFIIPHLPLDLTAA